MLRILSRFGLVITATGAVLAVTVAALVVPLGMLGHVGSGKPAPIPLDALEQRSYIYAADGSLLAALHGEFNRQPVALAEVPPHVVNAILAVEDSGFWTHNGVDGRALLRAFSVNVGSGDVSQGASTITQQLVKLSILSPEKTLDRKVQEIVLARRLERQMTKEEILTRYLNTVYFGNHAYGIQAAAETYFGVSAVNLDVAQAALLAAVIRNPSAYNPVRFPERATKRRNIAVDRMFEEGIVNADEAAFIKAIPVPAAVQQVLPEPNDYFVEEVKQQLLDDPRMGATREQREQAVFTGGIKVFTTFDPRAQALALQARNGRLGEGGVFEAGPAINPGTGGPFLDEQGNPLYIDPATGEPETLLGTASIVSVEPSTGAIRAMVGGPGFDQSNYNLATQTPPRQIGSSFKPIVLATLFEQGHSPNDLVDGTSPCTFITSRRGPNNVYKPSNYDEGNGTGIGTLTEQTVNSVNCAFVRLGYIAGLENVVDTAKRLGITNPELLPYPANMLGSQGGQVVEMAGAYAAFANDGTFNPPYYVDRVEDAQGRVILEHQPDPRPVVSPQTARLISQVLEQNVRRGTGTGAQLPDGRPAAGKTGTTQSNADGWFCGYTPQLATAVWVGAMRAQVSVTYGGRRLFGGGPGAGIWHDYMQAWSEGLEILDFPAPEPPPAGRFLQVPREIDPGGLTPTPDPPPEDPPPGGGGGPGGGNTIPTFTLPTQPVRQPPRTTPTTIPPVPTLPTIPPTQP